MEPTQPELTSYEALAAENVRLRQQVADLTEQLAAALAEIARLKRSGKRQATPGAMQMSGSSERGSDPTSTRRI